MKRFIILLSAITFCITIAMRPDEVSLNGYFLTLKPWKYNGMIEVPTSGGKWKSIDNSRVTYNKNDLFTFYKGEHLNIGTYTIKVASKRKPSIEGSWWMTTNGRIITIDHNQLFVVKCNRDTLQIVRGKGEDRERYTFIH